MKIKGTFIHGKWFCSENCSNQDPEVKELEEQLSKGIEFNNENDEIDEDEEEDVEIDLWFLN